MYQCFYTFGFAVRLSHPAVKVGIDTGAVTCDVSPATARLAYRGRPMNRAARVVDKVPSGQVWCTAETVAQAGLTADSPLLRTEEVGTFTLKVGHCHTWNVAHPPLATFGPA